MTLDVTHVTSLVIHDGDFIGYELNANSVIKIILVILCANHVTSLVIHDGCFIGMSAMSILLLIHQGDPGWDPSFFSSDP